MSDRIAEAAQEGLRRGAALVAEALGGTVSPSGGGGLVVRVAAPGEFGAPGQPPRPDVGAAVARLGPQVAALVAASIREGR